MKVEVRLIVVNFHDPAYSARLEISDIVIQSTTPEWRPATLALTRYKNEHEDSVIIYKMCSIGNIKLEGWSLEEGGGGGAEGGGEGRGEGEGVEGGEGRGEGGVEGGEGRRWGYTGNENAKVKLRLIAGETNIRFTLKRKLEDCSILTLYICTWQCTHRN